VLPINVSSLRKRPSQSISGLAFEELVVVVAVASAVSLPVKDTAEAASCCESRSWTADDVTVVCESRSCKARTACVTAACPCASSPSSPPAKSACSSKTSCSRRARRCQGVSTSVLRRRGVVVVVDECVVYTFPAKTSKAWAAEMPVVSQTALSSSSGVDDGKGGGLVTRGGSKPSDENMTSPAASSAACSASRLLLILRMDGCTGESSIVMGGTRS
jgi:hypothetical protein